MAAATLSRISTPNGATVSGVASTVGISTVGISKSVSVFMAPPAH